MIKNGKKFTKNGILTRVGFISENGLRDKTEYFIVPYNRNNSSANYNWIEIPIG